MGILGIIVAMGLVQSCLIFFLVIRRGTLVAITASVSLTALSYVQFLNPTANWYGLFLVIVVICVLSWRPQDGRWRLEALGFLVVTLLMVRQLTGVIVAIGVVTYLIGEAQCGASGRDRLLARALVATMACGLGAYLLLMTDPLVTLMFGIWPLGILAWVWRSAAANREVLGILARLALGGIIAAAPLLLYHIVYGSLAAWLGDGIGAAGSLNELEFMRRMTYAAFVIWGVHEVISVDTLDGVLNGAFWTVITLLATVHGFVVLRTLLRMGGSGRILHPLPVIAVFYAVVSAIYQSPSYLFFTVGLTLAGLLWMSSGWASWYRHVPVALACALSAIGLYYHAAQPYPRDLIRGERIALVASHGLDRVSLWIKPGDLALYSHLVDVIQREAGREEMVRC